VTRDGRTPDHKSFVVRRPLLPAGLGSALADNAMESDSGSGNPLVRLLFRVLVMLTIGLALLPISIFFRVLLRRWTVDAAVGGETKRWRAKSRAAAGKGVEAVAGALTRGEALDQPFTGLTPA
jgi:hypothetical protein